MLKYNKTNPKNIFFANFEKFGKVKSLTHCLKFKTIFNCIKISSTFVLKTVILHTFLLSLRSCYKKRVIASASLSTGWNTSDLSHVTCLTAKYPILPLCRVGTNVIVTNVAVTTVTVTSVTVITITVTIESARSFSGITCVILCLCPLCWGGRGGRLEQEWLLHIWEWEWELAKPIPNIWDWEWKYKNLYFPIFGIGNSNEKK